MEETENKSHSNLYIPIGVAALIIIILAVTFLSGLLPLGPRAPGEHLTISIQQVQYINPDNVHLTLLSSNTTIITSYTVWCQSDKYTNSTVHFALTSGSTTVVNIFSPSEGTHYTDFGPNPMNPYHLILVNSNGAQTQLQFNVVI